MGVQGFELDKTLWTENGAFQIADDFAQISEHALGVEYSRLSAP